MIYSQIYKCNKCSQPCIVDLRHPGFKDYELMNDNDKKRCLSFQGLCSANFELVEKNHKIVNENKPKKIEKKIDNSKLKDLVSIILTTIETRESVKSKTSDVKPDQPKSETPFVWHM